MPPYLFIILLPFTQAGSHVYQNRNQPEFSVLQKKITPTKPTLMVAWVLRGWGVSGMQSWDPDLGLFLQFGPPKST